MNKHLTALNLLSIKSNITTGFLGIVTYPTIQYLTTAPFGCYAVMCYSIHHIHVINLLKNEAINCKKITGYTNFTFKRGIFFSDTRKSIYSIKNNSNYNLWYCNTLNNNLLSSNNKLIINSITTIRDNNTRMYMGSILSSCIVSCYLNMPFYSLISVGMVCSILMNIMILTNINYKIDSVIRDVKILTNKRYMYINTFGNIVFTNYKYGLYKRYRLN